MATMKLIQRLICRWQGHQWSAWYPVNPERVRREPQRAYLEMRHCQRCDLRPELREREAAEDWFFDEWTFMA